MENNRGHRSCWLLKAYHLCMFHLPTNMWRCPYRHRKGRRAEEFLACILR